LRESIVFFFGFFSFTGTHYVDNTLYNSELVWQLWTKYDESLMHGNQLENETSEIGGIL